MRKFFYGALPITLALSMMPTLMAAEQTSIVSQTQISSTITTISLSDDEILVDGDSASTDTSSSVYTSHDIIYYEDRDTYDSGNTYGEGTDSDKHSAQEAMQHTVVNITEAGTYRISGQLSYGQIFVNVGKDEEDKVTLILDNADINCTVAPAILFYKVYECDDDATTDTASHIVDTSEAGARIIIADDSINNISGSYVAKIYKDNTEQKKLHKYDGAFYSRMSMEIDGESKGNGILNITSDKEGLDTELHLTINGGHINIQSCDDGINVNEDGISVFTMNDGYLNLYAGNGSEGDGIDSNGWNVINDGTVIALANPNSPDGGIDSDMGSFINGGTVIGAGNMYDPLEDDSEQLFMLLELAQQSDSLLTVTNENDEAIFAYDFPYNYNYVVFSTPTLTEGTYHVYEGGSIVGEEQDGFYSNITSYTEGTQLHHGGTSTNNGMMSGANGEMPTPPEGSEDGEVPTPPEGSEDGEVPTPPEGSEDGEVPTPPEGSEDGEMPTPPGGITSSSETESYDFVLTTSNKCFTNVSSAALTSTDDSIVDDSVTDDSVSDDSVSDDSVSDDSVSDDSVSDDSVSDDSVSNDSVSDDSVSDDSVSDDSIDEGFTFDDVPSMNPNNHNPMTPNVTPGMPNNSHTNNNSVPNNNINSNNTNNHFAPNTIPQMFLDVPNHNKPTEPMTGEMFADMFYQMSGNSIPLPEHNLKESLTIDDVIDLLTHYGKGGNIRHVENLPTDRTQPATYDEMIALLTQYLS